VRFLSQQGAFFNGDIGHEGEWVASRAAGLTGFLGQRGAVRSVVVCLLVRRKFV